MKKDTFNPKSIRNLRWLRNRGGCIISSEFVEGHGKRTRSLDIPPHCKKIIRELYAYQPARIKRVFDAPPRCQAVVAIVEMRRANGLLNALAAQS